MIRCNKLLLATAVAIALTSAPHAMAQRRQFNVPTQPAVTGIPEFARQAQLQIIAPADALDGVNTQAVVGEGDARQTLRTLLRDTGLEIKSDDGRVILLQPSRAGEPGAGSGTVLGSVLDPATGGYLRDAVVRITSSAGTRVVHSGERGEFQLAGVPVGTVEVTVSYTGFHEERRTIELEPGERERLEFQLRSTWVEAGTSGTRTLDSLQVVGVREGDARAIMEQRAAMNITNTLSADSFGEIGDGNPGEFLKYMPGVDFDVVADDAPRNISLRGLPAKYTGVTLNGVSLPGIDANSSSSRTFSFEQSALAGVDSISINKTTSADMDANAPAGTIDIRTRKAFDAKGRRVVVSLGGTTHSGLWDSRNTGWMEGGYDTKWLPSSSITYSDVFFDKRLGITAGISSITNLVEQAQITAGRNYVATATSPYPYAVTSIAASGYDREYNRRVASFNADFKATDTLILSLSANLSRGDIDPNTITPTFTNGRATAANPHEGDPSLDWTTRYPASTNTLALNHSYTYKVGYSRNFVPSFVWQNENLKVDGNLFSATSTSRYDSVKKGQVSNLLNTLSARGNYSASRSDWMHQDWQIQQIDGIDWASPDAFTLGSYAGALGASTRPSIRTTSGSSAELDYRGGALNVEFYQDIGRIPVTWKTGVKATRAGYEFGNTSDANIWTYNGPLSNAEFLRAVQSRNVWHGGESGMDIRTLSGGDVYLYSLARIHQMMQANPEQWIRSETAAQWYNAHIANVNELDERITSLYFMGTADFTERLKGQAGLRWERTREIGYDFDPLSPDQVRAAGYAVSAATGRAATVDGLKYQYLTNPRKETEGRYDDFFPSASLKYSVTDSLDIHAGYSKTIMRPEVGDLAGVWSIAYGTEDGNVLSAPNASLKPEYSDNFSLRATQYFEPVGLVAFGVFHNRIKDLIDTATLTPEEFGYDGDEPVDLVSTATNSAADITVNGYEFEFNHAMDYLPGPLSGLTLRGHFTNTNPSKKLSRVAQQVAGLGFGWKYGPIRLNLNSVWSDEKDRGPTSAVSVNNGNGAYSVVQEQPFDDYLEVNLSGSYTLIPKTRDNWLGLEVYFSANNLFDQNRHTVYSNGPVGLGAGGHHSQIYITSGRRASLGIRARF
ncbi:MAG: TonB-dependent receptor [Pseudoxanthomonas sp.]|jgi:TonB-dependent receptor|uniref:TonB-dependent receptor domain-containing protein n=1 Tax=Pseudoxanthomonas TaxID=83618 RepID=UPI00258767FD|nr:TonB-dependent receptor [Pseudoxanthomonas sp.]MCH2090875.1 TonB-dependent receptor [Pseudoxanthomonas sp.]